MTRYFLALFFVVIVGPIVLFSESVYGQDSNTPLQVPAVPGQTEARVMTACNQWLTNFETPGTTGYVVEPCTDDGNAISASFTYPGWISPYSWSYPYYVDPNAAQCTAGTFSPTFPAEGNDTGQVCIGGCEEQLNIGGGPGGSSGMKTTGNSCAAGTANTPSEPMPPVAGATCSATGLCTYCDNLGNCVSGQRPDDKPPTVASAQGGAPASAGPTDPASGAPTANGSPAGDSGAGTGTGGTGTGTGASGTGSGANPGVGGSIGPNNGDFAKGPASSTSTACTAGDACNAGQASGDIGTLYQPTSQTLGSAYGDFKTQVSSSPLIGSATSFFSVNVTGTCPSWHIPGNKFWGEAGFDFTFFCDPGMIELLTLAGYVVLAIGAFCAFRIALY